MGQNSKMSALNHRITGLYKTISTMQKTTDKIVGALQSFSTIVKILEDKGIITDEEFQKAQQVLHNQTILEKSIQKQADVRPE